MNTTAPPPRPDATPPPPSDTPRTRRLVRIRDDKKIAGVTTGLGWYFGVDPLLFRIGFIALAIGGFIAVPAYVIAWVLLPESSRAEESGQPVTSSAPMASLRQRLRLDGDDPRSWLTLGLGALCIILIGAQIESFSGELMLGAILVGIGALLFLDRDERQDEPGGASTSSDSAADPVAEQEDVDPQPRSAYDSSYAAAAPQSQWQSQGRQPPSDRPFGPGGHGHPRGRRGPGRGRPKSILGRLAVGMAMLAVGATVLLDRIGLAELTPISVTAVVVGVVGVALLVGSVLGRARGLIVIGLVGTIALAGMNAASDINLASGFGDRSVSITAADELAERYELVAGQLRLDLSRLQLDEARTTEVAVTAGRLEVIVPEDLPVRVGGHVTAGDYEVLGVRGEGTDLTIDVDGTEVGDGETPTLTIEMDATLGEVIVRRARVSTLEETQ